jgi:hypothetical protein
MPVASAPERLRDDLVRLVHRGADVRGFALGAARILARAVPFEGVCVLTMDPATLVPTGEVVENGLPTSECTTATLSQATGGELDRSERHREVRGPNGLVDELRSSTTKRYGDR